MGDIGGDFSSVEDDDEMDAPELLYCWSCRGFCNDCKIGDVDEKAVEFAVANDVAVAAAARMELTLGLPRNGLLLLFLLFGINLSNGLLPLAAGALRRRPAWEK